MIKSNWHTHTIRCGHAVGTDEEYIQAAIKAGLHTLGFSDHAAYPTPMPRERMDISQVDEYVYSIRKLQKKYENQINIYVGMEVECYQDQWETLSKYRKMMDYLILGQHNLSIDKDSAYDINHPVALHQYVDQIEYACAHHLCEVICHPDVALFHYQKLDSEVQRAAERLAQISLTYHVPLELNCGLGVRLGMKEYEDGMRYAYPTRIFFEEFARQQAPIIIGLDIHKPELFLTDEYLNRALDIVKDLNLNILYDYDLIAQANKHKELFVYELNEK